LLTYFCSDCKGKQGKIPARNGTIQAEKGGRSCQREERRGRIDENSESRGLATTQEKGKDREHHQENQRHEKEEAKGGQSC